MLPPLEWVRVFEAAARLGSFTAAAQEAGLTQAAVSQRIRDLESRLGVQLFDRLARGVALTTAGEAWLPHVQSAFALLGNSTANLFAAPRRKVNVAVSTSILELWILPRLHIIRRSLPQVQLVFETIQRLPDYHRSDADLEIRFGNGHWSDRDSRRLFREVLSPLAAPALLKGEAGRDWRELPRLAVSGPRAGWTEWANECGETQFSAPIIRFDTFAHALHAAEAGAGVLLGSLPLCADAVRAARLVRLSERVLPMEDGYWATWLRNRSLHAELVEVIDAVCRPPDST